MIPPPDDVAISFATTVIVNVVLAFAAVGSVTTNVLPTLKSLHGLVAVTFVTTFEAFTLTWTEVPEPLLDALPFA